MTLAPLEPVAHGGLLGSSVEKGKESRKAWGSEPYKAGEIPEVRVMCGGKKEESIPCMWAEEVPVAVGGMGTISGKRAGSMVVMRDVRIWWRG